MAKTPSPSLVTVGAGRNPFSCTVCRGALFSDRELKIVTAESLGRSWQEKVSGLLCQQCGYVHTFMPGSVELWRPEDGYPGGG